MKTTISFGRLQAATAGLQQANRRGLLSSSMAVGSAQDSVLKVATPIGAQTASQNASANLSRQGFEQTRVINQDQIAAQVAQQDKDIAAQYGLQAKDIAAERERFMAQIASNEKLSAKEIVAARNTQLREIETRYGLQRKDAEAALKQIEAQGKSQLSLQQNQNAFSRNESKLGRDMQEKLAKWNLSAADREQAAGMLNSFSSSYEASLDAINRNENLSAEARTAQINALNARREKQMGMVRELYDIDIRWPSSAAPGSKPRAKPKPGLANRR